jgi:hypothetical protein
MKQNKALKEKELRNKINGKFGDVGSAYENKGGYIYIYIYIYIYHHSNLFLSKTEIQSLLHPAQDSLGFFCMVSGSPSALNTA